MGARSAESQYHMLSKIEFIQLLEKSIKEKAGFAAGKAGFSEQAFLRYSLISSQPDSLKKRAYEAFLKYHCDYMTGVFPSTPKFLKIFAQFFLENIGDLNILGLMDGKNEFQLMSSLQIEAKLTYFQSMEPDRSIPENLSLCYLLLFRGKKILLISPYAEFIASRAKADIYDSVWQASEKKWFSPLSIEALNIPYSYISASETHALYHDSVELYQTICTQISKLEFDIALIGAGALGMPIARYVKSLGKVGLSLGGHLQVIFGVAGGRWRNDPDWVARYLNEYWVDVPPNYHPPLSKQLSDGGAYW
jgi:hypothetical protein